MKTPSVAHTCRCTWWFSAEPKRCKKEMAPSRGRAAAGAAASIVTSAAVLSSRSISARKIFVRAATASGRLEPVRGLLAEGVPDLYGRVDLLTEDADTLVVTDIKTSRGRWSPEQVEDSGEQLLLYSHLASEIAPKKRVQTRFLIITKTREPVIEEHVREVNPAAVKRTLAGVERVWRAIESGVFYPAPSTMNCASCGYRSACRAWMG
jgi:CRISPR/Cas system-associated exonuclease Cas4 (RecB family)